MPRKRKSYPELEALRHLLGKVPDHEVAARAGTSASIVGRYRRSLKIDAYDGYKFGNSKGAEEAEPVAAPAEPAPAAPEAKAEAPAVPEEPAAPEAPAAPEESTSGRKSKITPFHDQVGTIPDKEVAKLAGVSTEAVRMYRRRRGIDLQVEKKATPKKKRQASRRKSRLDPFFDQLGKVPDAEIAAQAGVTPENVRAYRSRHGIKAEYRRTRRKKAGAVAVVEAVAAVEAPVVEAPAAPEPVVEVEVAAPVVEPTVEPVAEPVEEEAAAAPATAEADAPTLYAYSVQVEGGEEAWVLFAPDVAKAAVRAMTAMGNLAPGARIDSITHLGRALV